MKMLNHVECKFRKICLFCWMLNMLYMLIYSGRMWGQAGPNRDKTIQHIQPCQYFSRKKRVSETALNVIQHIQHLSTKKVVCTENVLFSAETLNMLNHVEWKSRKRCFFLLRCCICCICWMIWGLWEAKRDQIEQTNSTYSTCSKFHHKEALFSETTLNVIQQIQHFIRGARFCWRLECVESCWI